VPRPGTIGRTKGLSCDGDGGRATAPRRRRRACLDRAARWSDQHTGLSTTYLQELAAFRAEAEGVLPARPELPADVFAGPH
jgi:hypothetical protein